MVTNTTIDPVISVCIANYNGEHLLTACIQSVIDQSFEQPIEIIVHDDASSDDSVNLIKTQFPQVILIESQNNVGFCISNNRMVDKANGHYILLLNNDATLHNDALQTLFGYAQKQTKQGILGLPQYDIRTGELVDRGMLLDPFLTPVPNLNSEINNVGLVIGACLWLPKSLWIILGGFPEWFVTLAEDLYLCCLARLQNYPVQIINQSGFNHISGASLGGGKIQEKKMSTSIRRRKLSEQNRTFIIFICYPGPAIYFIFPIHLLVLLIEGSFLCLMKKEFYYWTEIYGNCFRALWKNRQILIKTRNIAQKHRTATIKQFFSTNIWYLYKLRMLFRFGIPEIS